MRSFVEHRAQHGVAAFGDAAIIVDLARLMSPRGQSDMCADRPGMDEALGLIDGCPVRQGNDDAYSGGGHKTPTNRIMADRVEEHFVEDGKLLPHDPPDGEEWLDDQREPGESP